MTVEDAVRERIRRPAARPSRRRVLIRRWVAVLALLGMIAFGAALLFTPLLGVSRVDVTGNTALTADEVRTAAAIPHGAPMLRLSTAAIATRVSALPRVATVDVSRSFPFTVRIRVTERQPTGYLPASDGAHLVDATGRDYATVPQAPAGLLQLQLPHADPADPTTRAVIAVLGALPAQLRPTVQMITAQSAGSVRFTLADGRTVKWGSASDSDRKAAVLGPLLTRPGKVYDVSSPTLPTVQ